MARTNKKGGNTAGLKGSPFKIFGLGGTKVGGFLNKAFNSTPIGMGVNALRGKTDAPTFGGVGEKLMGGGGMNPAMDPANAAQMGGVGAGAPMMKKEGFTPYKKSTPFKTDATLVKGAYDAASGMGTDKYGQIAQARAFGDMVDTVEDTVNKSSKAQYQKDRRRSKRKTRSDERYADWRERFARREDLKERAQSRWREGVDVITGGTDYDFDPNKTDVQEGDYGAFWKRKTKK